MNLNPNIERIKKAFTKRLEVELQDVPIVEGQKRIKERKVKEIYESILKKMYPKNWESVGMVVGLKESLMPFPLLDEVMCNFKYEYDYSLENPGEYFQRTE